MSDLMLFLALAGGVIFIVLLWILAYLDLGVGRRTAMLRLTAGLAGLILLLALAVYFFSVDPEANMGAWMVYGAIGYPAGLLTYRGLRDLLRKKGSHQLPPSK